MILSRLFIAFAILLSVAARGETFYVSQAGGGGTNAMAWFNGATNWANPKTSGKVGPGDLVFFVGTITNEVFLRGSGTPSAPITISSGVMLAPTYTNNPVQVSTYTALSGDGVSNLVVTNFLISCTANGTGLATSNDVAGVYLSGCSGVTVCNCIITNLYARVFAPDSTNSDYKECGRGIYCYGPMLDITISGNVLMDAVSGVLVAYGTACTNVQIYSNIIARCSTGIAVGSTGSGSYLDSIQVWANSLSDNNWWDGTWTAPPGDGRIHSDGVHVWAYSTDSALNHVSIFRNQIGPNCGTHTTGYVYSEASQGWIYDLKVFNNLFYETNATSYPAEGYIALKEQLTTNLGPHDKLIANNTFCGNGLSTGIYMDGWVNYSMTNVVLLNNLIYNLGGGFNTGDTSDYPTNSDYNIFYTVYGTASRGGGYIPLVTWQGQSGQEAHSTTNQPGMTNLIPTDSVALAKGTNLTAYGISTDFLGRFRGNVWDIGAYQSTPPPPTFSLQTLIIKSP